MQIWCHNFENNNKKKIISEKRVNVILKNPPKVKMKKEKKEIERKPFFFKGKIWEGWSGTNGVIRSESKNWKVKQNVREKYKRTWRELNKAIENDFDKKKKNKKKEENFLKIWLMI